MGQLVDGHVAPGWTRRREPAASRFGSTVQCPGTDTVTAVGVELQHVIEACAGRSQDPVHVAHGKLGLVRPAFPADYLAVLVERRLSTDEHPRAATQTLAVGSRRRPVPVLRRLERPAGQWSAAARTHRPGVQPDQRLRPRGFRDRDTRHGGPGRGQEVEPIRRGSLPLSRAAPGCLRRQRRPAPGRRPGARPARTSRNRLARRLRSGGRSARPRRRTALRPSSADHSWIAIGSPVTSSMGTAPIPGPSGAVIRPPLTVGPPTTVAFFRPFGWMTERMQRFGVEWPM